MSTDYEGLADRHCNKCGANLNEKYPKEVMLMAAIIYTVSGGIRSNTIDSVVDLAIGIRDSTLRQIAEKEEKQRIRTEQGFQE